MITYTKTNSLLKLQDVCLSFAGRIILNKVNAEVLDIERDDMSTQGQVVCFLGPSGIGKCFAKGTPILMFDGTISPVENIAIGDQLMGPDSKPKTVLSLGRGIDALYEIVPRKGQSHTVNSAHILALRLHKSHRSCARHEEITVVDYLTKSKTFKNRAHLYRTSIDFSEQPVPIDPYIFGLWLGDGDCSSPAITTDDPEVVAAITNYAIATNSRIGEYFYKDRTNRYGIVDGGFQTLLKHLGVFSHKHVPQIYKSNSREIRLQLLAGLMDSDGHLGIGSGCFDFVSIREVLADDVCYLARSVGLAAYKQKKDTTCQTGAVGMAWRVIISGHIETIPTKIPRKQATRRQQIKDVLHTGFEVNPAGQGEYFGFELDGDGLCVLGDFTVTHNTQLARLIAGLNTPTSGHITLGSKNTASLRGLVGYVQQSYPLFNYMTAAENLAVAAKMGLPKQGLEARVRMDNYCEKLGISEATLQLYPKQLSGGQRQRIAIIRQLLCSDHLLILDEPFSGLDLKTKQATCRLISDVAAMDTLNTIIIITHDVTEGMSISDMTWLMGIARSPSDRAAKGSEGLTPGQEGASIVETYDLAAEGLAWQPDIIHDPRFMARVSDVKKRFLEVAP